MKLVARIDTNQPDLVAEWRGLGLSVHPTHQLGGGFVDAVIGAPGLSIVTFVPLDEKLLGFVLDKMGVEGYVIHQGVNLLAEIKDGSKKPSAQKLTPDEQIFYQKWRGQIAVVNSKEAARKLVVK